VREGRMSLLGRSVWLVLVVTLVFSCVKNSVGTKRVVWVTNTLTPAQDLAITCSFGEYLGGYLVTPQDHVTWENYDDIYDFKCTLEWSGDEKPHVFRMYDEYRDADCNPCLWFVKQNAACRFNGTFTCYNWRV